MIKEYPACPFCMNAPRYLAFQEGFHAEAVICDTCKFSLPPDTWCNRVEQYVHAGYVSVSALECLAEVTNENMQAVFDFTIAWICLVVLRQKCFLESRRNKRIIRALAGK
jgi:hypothetical protein